LNLYKNICRFTFDAMFYYFPANQSVEKRIAD